VGKTVIIQELIHNVAMATAAARCSAAWASAPERQRSLPGMKESGVLKSCSLIYGQMNEPPGARCG